MVKDTSKNSKQLWKYVKSQNKETTGVATLHDERGDRQHDARKKANIFNDQFCKVFSDPAGGLSGKLHDDELLPDMHNIFVEKRCFETYAKFE